MKYHQIVKPGESKRQALQRLSRARAQAKRAGSSTARLDEKIRYLQSMTDVATPCGKPSGSKFRNYQKVSKRPMRGGLMTPK